MRPLEGPQSLCSMVAAEVFENYLTGVARALAERQKRAVLVVGDDGGVDVSPEPCGSAPVRTRGAAAAIASWYASMYSTRPARPGSGIAFCPGTRT